jgi:integrase
MLTDKTIKELKMKLPAKGMRIVPDGKVPRFGLRITAAGAMTFVVRYRNRGGVDRTYSIGSYPSWSPAPAREEAKRINMLVDQGEDPHADKDAERTAPDMKRLAERYIAEHLPKKRPRSRRDDEAMLRMWILPALGSKKVVEVRAADIEDVHTKVTKAGSPIRANRCVALLSKMFSLSVRWEMRADNPVRGAVERNAEVKRKVYLTIEEIARLSDALAAHPDQDVADAVRLLLLSGARRSEVLAARWDQFRDDGLWIKPGATTKQETEHEAPLSAPALDLLARRRAKATTAYVFPGHHGRPHLTEIKKSWKMLCEAAKLKGVRLHDIRHYAASVLVNIGETLPLIGALLGHTQVSTTARYAHLYVDPQRAAANRLGAVITGKDVALRKGS